MQEAIPFAIGAFALGGLAAGTVVWLLMRTRMRGGLQAAQAVAEQEKALLQERLRTTENTEQLLRTECAQRAEQEARLHAELRRVDALRAGAEEKASRLPSLEEELERRRREAAALQANLRESDTRLEEERRAAAEKLAFLEEARVKLSDAFQALSAEALKSSNTAFLELAKENLKRFQESAQGDLAKRQENIEQMVKPIRESLEKVHTQIQEVEKARTGAYSTLTEQVKNLAQGQNQLQLETGRLVTALRSPVTRGRWGEIQLQRVVELAGMLEHCDFEQQASMDTEAGRLRPDMLVRLPNGKVIVVDAKVSLDAYLKAIEADTEEARTLHLQGHAKQVRDHVTRLSAKSYWSQFDNTPEFVVLFLPGEPFFSAALQHDPELIETGVDNKVILATPTTLIALLKAVAFGWRQESIAQNAREISELGKELYGRICTLGEHFARVGKGLGAATDAYNKAAGTLESRVLVGARRFKDLKVGTGKELDLLSPVETAPREIQAQEILPLPDLLQPPEAENTE